MNIQEQSERRLTESELVEIAALYGPCEPRISRPLFVEWNAYSDQLTILLSLAFIWGETTLH